MWSDKVTMGCNASDKIRRLVTHLHVQSHCVSAFKCHRFTRFWLNKTNRLHSELMKNNRTLDNQFTPNMHYANLQVNLSYQYHVNEKNWLSLSNYATIARMRLKSVQIDFMNTARKFLIGGLVGKRLEYYQEINVKVGEIWLATNRK